jgi:hypothetical protein
LDIPKDPNPEDPEIIDLFLASTYMSILDLIQSMPKQIMPKKPLVIKKTKTSPPINLDIPV